MMNDLYAYTFAEARRKYLAILQSAVPADNNEGMSIYVNAESDTAISEYHGTKL